MHRPKLSILIFVTVLVASLGIAIWPQPATATPPGTERPTGYPIFDYETYPPGVGSTYYLDANYGDDNNDGSAGHPWQTLAKALNEVTSGDTVILASGEYGSFTESAAPPRDDWITFKAAPGAQVTFTGGIHLNYGEMADAYLRFDGIHLIREDGNLGLFYDVRNLEVRNCRLTGTNKYLVDNGFYIVNAENILLYQNEIVTASTGMYAAQTRHSTISSNYFHGLGGGSGIRYGDDSTNVVIERNHVYDSNWDPSEPYAPTDPHSSAVSIRSNNVLIRENIFHDIGTSSGIMFYEEDAAGGEPVYGNIYLENNLLYDIHNTAILRLDYVGEDVFVRNNTIIGTIYHSKQEGPLRLGVPLNVNMAAGYDGSGVYVSNNIFAGLVILPEATQIDNNLMWAYRTVEGGWNYFCEPPEPGSIVLTCQNGDYPIEYFTEGFFVESPDFDGHHQSFDFHLASSSPAVNAGNPNIQVGASMGRMNAAGFIQANGLPRDEYQHSVGCYEVPALQLSGAPASETIYLHWQVQPTLPVSTTWRIEYTGPAGQPPSPISGLPEPERSYTLTELTNYNWYEVTLQAMLDGAPILSDTLQIMPTDQLIYLPITTR
jgi:hypothetical protein